MKSTIFVSGPHGSGKTTLINQLLKEHSIFQENNFEIDFTQEFPSIKTMTFFERCLLRLYHRLYVGRYSGELSLKNPDNIIITSRSIYDSAAYIKSYREMNWLTDEQTDKMNFIIQHSDHAPYTIILNPTFRTIKSRLEKRRNIGIRKTRDEVFSYEDSDVFIQSMHESFSGFRDLKNTLYIEDNGKKEIDVILDWVKQITTNPCSQNKDHETLSCLQASV